MVARDLRLQWFDDNVARVQRARHFCVNLHTSAFWRSTLLAFDTPETFAGLFTKCFRPFLLQAEECILLGEERPTLNPNIRKHWTAAGAPAHDWYGNRVVEIAGLRHVRLTPDVLDDHLFWWWLLPGLSGLHPVLLTDMARFDSSQTFSVAAKAHYLGGDRFYEAEFRFAKGITRRNDKVAIVCHPRMTLHFVAAAANLTSLFKCAMERATFEDFEMWRQHLQAGQVPRDTLPPSSAG